MIDLAVFKLNQLLKLVVAKGMVICQAEKIFLSKKFSLHRERENTFIVKVLQALDH